MKPSPGGHPSDGSPTACHADPSEGGLPVISHGSDLVHRACDPAVYLIITNRPTARCPPARISYM